VSNQTIAFIGAGNMARSLITGLVKSGHPPDRIRASDPMTEQLEALRSTGIITVDSNSRAAEGAEIVVLAVKPQVLGAVLSGLKLGRSQLLISIAAGVPLQSLEAWSSANQPIVRCMPNTPALLGAGISGLFPNPAVSDAQRSAAEAVLSAAGKAIWVGAETLLDAVTAVSGSGPAYFFYLMEAMVEAGVNLGLDRDTATSLTLETAYGAALMAKEGDLSPTQLRRNVTSPGGTTERALSILDAADSRAVIGRALAGAAERSRELAEEFGRR
jgi:pyrroline-5-carboxylate reductase